VKYLEENAGAAAVKLSSEDVAKLSAMIPAGAAQGGRYYDQAMAALNR
jgi:aryl-alcohol dehydrogenase-like predicted oxidoreductase